MHWYRPFPRVLRYTRYGTLAHGQADPRTYLIKCNGPGGRRSECNARSNRRTAALMVRLSLLGPAGGVICITSLPPSSLSQLYYLFPLLLLFISCIISSLFSYSSYFLHCSLLSPLPTSLALLCSHSETQVSNLSSSKASGSLYTRLSLGSSSLLPQLPLPLNLPLSSPCPNCPPPRALPQPLARAALRLALPLLLVLRKSIPGDPPSCLSPPQALLKAPPAALPLGVLDALSYCPRSPVAR